MIPTLLSAAALAGGAFAQQSRWGQCGGISYSGPTNCESGNACTTQNPYYAQCVPGTAPPPQPTKTSMSTVVKTASTAPDGGPTAGSGETLFAGINIAGFDFGCLISGACDLSKTYGPTGGDRPDGIAQMQHFVNDDNLNIFRLPVAWQYLVNNNLGGPLDQTNVNTYDQLMQGCLKTGAYCILDVHNYARWNGAIIGQGGPSNDQFTNLWSQLAAKYASEERVWFGTMNEPHDVDISAWGETVQMVVTAIRKAGATSQYISLPGNDFQSAGTFLSDGSSTALVGITDPDGTNDKLIFDVHNYLDSDYSGTHTECVTNNIDGAFSPLATWLRQQDRQAILTETGGGNTQSCEKYVCEELNYLNENSDVYLGYVTWSAGSFDNTYELDETPSGGPGSYTDTPLVSACIAR